MDGARKEVATMFNNEINRNAIGVGVAAARTHAAHAAAQAATVKHRAAAATDASVDRGLT
jgi:hypothetical protein